MRLVFETVLENIEYFVSGFVVFLLQFIYYLYKKIKEKVTMKYHSIDNVREQSSSLECKTTRESYVLDPVTNELQKLPEEEDFYSKIQSYIGCALDNVLNRMLNIVGEDDGQSDDDPSVSYVDKRIDLAALGEAMEVAEYYRDLFNMGASATMADIYARVDAEAQKAKAQILNYKKGGNEDVSQETASSPEEHA